MLSLTTKYAVRALEHLSKRQGGGYTSIKEIAEATSIGAPYLAKIMKALAAKRLIDSKKGLLGGIRLRQEGPALTLFDVALCLDDPISKDSCFLSRDECNQGRQCSFHSRWSGLRRQIAGFLNETVLWDPASKPRKTSALSRRAS